MSSEFSSKYYSKPEYKENHNKYMCEKVECACGITTARANMSHHRKSSRHIKRMIDNDLNKTIKELNETIDILERETEELQEENNKLRKINKKLQKTIKKMI